VKTLREQLEPQVNRLQGEMQAASTNIEDYKKNLDTLGDTSYEVEVTGGEPKATVCELGSVIIGVRLGLDNKFWITCSSIGRAVWTPSMTHSDAIEPK
jgi:hypothetical protein